jgi:6-phosphogluconolactonase (cycloisomerase 2 family)
VTVIDIEANPPRVLDKAVIRDSPDGFAISPIGKLAVALLLNGNDMVKNAWVYNRNGKVIALKIDGKKATRGNEIEVRGLPKGSVIGNDGRYIYVGNYLERDISILRVEGDQIGNTGRSLALLGQPASMRSRTR